MTKKIVNCVDLNMRKSYEMQADVTHKKMKAKIRQINKLKAYGQGFIQVIVYRILFVFFFNGK